ncbi:methylated-DNA--protein-cysteine methyltransferase [Procambarus clarkii]|uniref:methylated-DNA--protein-cysteine methyltransferase n=1 Tax=Procambarus clarkii TaxID=6728 RepID=UPI001E670163|nr:methylated-DNA--protein-cysteine methyltransferase-like [Procambarus clarkii]
MQKQSCCGSPGVDYCFSSPLGCINVTSCSSGLHAMKLDENITDENFSPNKRTKVQLLRGDLENEPEIIQQCLKWLQMYFTSPKLLINVSRPDICCFKQLSPGFHTRVWQTLADTVGPGEVITYGALATMLKNPGAVRAVGSAMRNNPNAIIVPCHRVVRSNSMGLYHGGKLQKVKLWLLNHEGVNKFT